MIDSQRIDNNIYKRVQELSKDPDVIALLSDLRIPAMKHFLLAQHQLLSESPAFKSQKEQYLLEKEVK